MDAVLLAQALPHPSRAEAVAAFSSTSVITKQYTEVASERAMIERLAAAERQIAATEQHGIRWTILPTLIYVKDATPTLRRCRG